VSLFERIRPHCEAAPWVCEEVKKLERENAALRKALEDAVGLARNTRADGRRDWVSVGTWLKPGECVILTDAAAIDAARKEGGAT
jgi:hypothetical protein